jgi:hypothetical protein
MDEVSPRLAVHDYAPGVVAGAKWVGTEEGENAEELLHCWLPPRIRDRVSYFPSAFRDSTARSSKG